MAKGRAPVVYFCKEVIYRAFSNTNLALFPVALRPVPVFLNLDSILLTIINHLSCLGKFIKSKNRGVNGSSRSRGFDIGSKFNCCGSWIEHPRKIEMYSVAIHRNTNCISLVQQNEKNHIRSLGQKYALHKHADIMCTWPTHYQLGIGWTCLTWKKKGTIKEVVYVNFHYNANSENCIKCFRSMSTLFWSDVFILYDPWDEI